MAGEQDQDSNGEVLQEADSTSAEEPVPETPTS